MSTNIKYEVAQIALTFAQLRDIFFKMSRKKLGFVIFLYIFSFAVRFFCLFHLKGFYANFLSDSSLYRLLSRSILSGSHPVFPVSPLYTFFVAGASGLFGDWSVLFFQILLTSLVPVLVFLMVDELTKRLWIPYLAGIFASLYAPSLFYCSLLLPDALFNLTNLIMLFFLFIGFKKSSFWCFLFAGISAGLSLLLRGNVALFVIAIFLYLLTRRKLRRYAVAFVLPALLVISPVIIGNIANGERLLLTSNAGINLFIGNNPAATGRYSQPPGLSLGDDLVGKKTAEYILGHKLTYSEASSFWAKKALHFIIDNPRKFFYLLLRKLTLFWSVYEVPQVENFYLAGRIFPLLLYNPFFFWISPLVIYGLYLFIRKRNWLIPGFVIIYFISLLPFFVVSRFRIGASGAMIVLAACSLDEFSPRLRKIFPLILAILFVVPISWFTFSSYFERDLASSYDNWGILHFYRGEYELAEERFESALEVKENLVEALTNLGAVRLVMGDTASAGDFFERAIDCDSTYGQAWSNLGALFVQNGDTASAYGCYKKAKLYLPFDTGLDDKLKMFSLWEKGDIRGMAELYERNRDFLDAARLYESLAAEFPDSIAFLSNAALLYQKAGDYAKAESLLVIAISLFPNNAILHNNLAGIYFFERKYELAGAEYERAISLDPGNPAIEKNYRFFKERTDAR